MSIVNWVKSALCWWIHCFFFLLLCLSNDNKKQSFDKLSPSHRLHNCTMNQLFVLVRTLMPNDLWLTPRSSVHNVDTAFHRLFSVRIPVLDQIIPRNPTLNCEYYSSRPLREAEVSQPTVSPYSQRWSQDSHSGPWGAVGLPPPLPPGSCSIGWRAACNDRGMLPSLRCLAWSLNQCRVPKLTRH